MPNDKKLYALVAAAASARAACTHARNSPRFCAGRCRAPHTQHVINSNPMRQTRGKLAGTHARTHARLHCDCACRCVVVSVRCGACVVPANAQCQCTFLRRCPRGGGDGCKRTKLDAVVTRTNRRGKKKKQCPNRNLLSRRRRRRRRVDCWRRAARSSRKYAREDARTREVSSHIVRACVSA